MFPEEVQNECRSTLLDSTQHTAVQRHLSPFCKHTLLKHLSPFCKHTLLKQISYEDDDAELATQVIRDLVKLLNDGDQVVVSQAAMVAYQLSEAEATLHAMMNSPQALSKLVAALVSAMTSSNDPETTKRVAVVLYNLSVHPQGLLAIFQSSAIPVLVTLLSSPDEFVLFFVIITLHGLLLHQEGSKMAVRSAGGIQKMVTLLQLHNVEILEAVVDCLKMLAYRDEENKLIILACDGPAELVRIMRSYTHENLLLSTSKVLGLLSVCSSNKRGIVEAGGIQVLAMHFGHQDKHLVLNCLKILRNVLDLATEQGEAAFANWAIPGLIQLLNDQNPVIVSKAVMAVYEFSKKEALRLAILNSPQLLGALVSAMTSSTDLETTKFAAGALYNLSSHLQGLQAIFQSSAVPALVKLLSSPDECVLFYAITTLHHLLLHQEESKMAVRSAGGIQKMVALLQLRDVEILTTVADCLTMLAHRNQENKIIILDCGGPAELVRIMRSYTDENLLWTTSKVLGLLSVCSSNKRGIVEAGGIEVLAMHFGQQNKHLVLNCLRILRNVSDLATEQVGLDPRLQHLLQLLRHGDAHVVPCAAGILANMNGHSYGNEIAVDHAVGMFWRLSCVLGDLVSTVNQDRNGEGISEPTIFEPRRAETEKGLR